MSVYRIYVEKKEPFAVEAAGVLASLRNDLGLSKLRHVRLLNRYDVEGISREVFDSVRDTVFSEPPVDMVYDELPAGDGKVFAIEYLPRSVRPAGRFLRPVHPARHPVRASHRAECPGLCTGGRHHR